MSIPLMLEIFLRVSSNRWNVEEDKKNKRFNQINDNQRSEYSISVIEIFFPRK